MAHHSADQEVVQIVYDGQCPACAAYFRYQRLELNGFKVQFIDARLHPEIVRAYLARGIDLNRDFVLRTGAAEFVGGDAAFVLASLGSRSNLFRKLNRLLLRSRAASHAIYRVLRLGRKLLLILLGRPLLDSHEI
jgi:predicted DCC family thiol-disulfide oxidoreductase YuxK